MVRPAVNSSRCQRRTDQRMPTRLEGADKAEIVDAFEDALSTIWARLAPTLGVITVRTILRRALHMAKERHPPLAHVAVTERGLSFSGLRAHLRDLPRSALVEGLRELVNSLFDILAHLSGSVLLDHVQRGIEGLADMKGAPPPRAPLAEEGSGKE